MTNDDGRQMLGIFHYVRDVFRNVGRLLQSCDPILQEMGFVPYDSSWKPFDMRNVQLTAPHLWLPHHAVRQFYPSEKARQAVLTVGALLWDPDPEGESLFTEPLAIASYMRVTDVSSAELYWVGLLQGWTRDAPPDGAVRALTNQIKRYEKAYATVVPDAILSAARPLVTITDTRQIREELIAPLVAAVRQAGV